MKDVLVVYRGPLERSRVGFILTALCKSYEHVVFVWVFPGKMTTATEEHFSKFISQYSVAETHILAQRLSSIRRTVREIKKIRASLGSNTDLAYVGISASIFHPFIDCRRMLWFINGIPEENNSGFPIGGRLMTWLQWKVFQIVARPSMVVTVSHRMNRYVARYFPKARLLAIPTVVDTDVFRFRGSPLSKRTGLFAYLGTGAPWQAIDYLSEVWQAIHTRYREIRFRVISRDPRTSALSTNIDAPSIEFVQSREFTQVASFLHESECGFILRRDTIVNRVSFPTKLAEYLAAGCWVVCSELDWDLTDYVRRFNVGVLIPVGMNAQQISDEIIKYRNNVDFVQLDLNIQSCLKELSVEHCVDVLRDALRSDELS